jgi:aspartyl-tRNA(Asn)/glutamyl-tRNA(Gln) amidotransferase subunit A
MGALGRLNDLWEYPSLDRIEKYNPVLNAFITVMGEQSLRVARQRDAERHRGKRLGPLHGIPIAVKDNLDTAGVRTTAASELFKDRVPQEDAEVVRRLKDAGAILLGKTNLQEFAYGGSSAVSCFGPVRNPWALERVPGGSSGGSAAATAAGLCFGSLGTDTAGSVRIPASYCGIVGLKATYGRVSNRGARCPGRPLQSRAHHAEVETAPGTAATAFFRKCGSADRSSGDRCDR